MPIEKVFIRTEFNYDRDKASNESGLLCLDESKTLQSAKEETDINTIVERFGVTGILPQNIQAPQNAHFEEIADFKDAMNEIVKARESFQAMPATVRAKFHNDAGEFVDFCSDPDNRPAMKKMGLLAPEPVSEPVVTPQTPKETPEKGVT